MTVPTTTNLDALRAELRGTSLQAFESTVDLPLLLVDLDQGTSDRVTEELHSGIARVVVGLTSADEPLAHPAAGCCDLVLAFGDPLLEVVKEMVGSRPIAAVALVMLLRGSERRDVDDGLHAESAVYSVLQAGPEFAAWRAGRSSRPVRTAQGDAVALSRRGGALDITLNRPEVRNALDATMRDQLVEAFRLVAIDSTITEVHLRGRGPGYSAGGDLDEFGSFVDPASSHLLRLQQSVGRAIHTVADRVTAHLHGACVGSGIELPAFAGTILADPSTRIALPETGLGLVPGAGGTVSLPRRIGRHRTAWLALTGQSVSARTSLDWGLVDGIEVDSESQASAHR